MKGTRCMLRAECIRDVASLVDTLAAQDVVAWHWLVLSEPETPACTVAFTTTASIETLRTCIALVPDGHVMGETLDAREPLFPSLAWPR